MKKIKLLLAAMAAIVSLGVQAGSDWVAPLAPVASDPVSGQTYKIRNVGAGQYLTGSSVWYSWSTSTALAGVNNSLNFTLSGDNTNGWTISRTTDGKLTFISGSKDGDGEMHVDMNNQGHQYFVFDKQDNGYYHIRAIASDANYGSSMDGYANKGWGWKGNNNSPNNAVYATLDVNNEAYSCDWEFVSTSALTTYAPTVEYAEMRAKVLAYIDMTDIYTDANGAVAALRAGVYAQDDVVDAATTAEEVNNATAAIRALILPFISSVTIKDGKSFNISDFIANPSFESSFTGWTNTDMATQSNNSFPGKVGSTYAEAWQPNGTKSVSQTLEGLPEGYYSLSANILARGVTSAKLYAGNDAEVYATIVDASNPYSLVFNCADNTNVTIGFEAVGTGAGASWVAVDNFGLTYLGKAPLVLFQNELAEAVSAARAHATALGSTIPAAALDNYNALINAAENNKASIDACQISLSALEAATANADALVAPYATYNIAKTNATFAGVSAATISEQDEIVAAATAEQTIANAAAALQAASDALAFDITSFTVTTPSPIANKAMAEGWEGDDFGDSSNGVSEYWNRSGVGFHQTVNLPAGRYRMTVVALQRTNMTGTVYAGETSTIIAQVPRSTANSRADAASWFGAGNGKNYVNFTLTDAADVTIGLRTDATTDDHWTVWQSFKLETFDESVAASYLAPGFEEAVFAAQAIYDDEAYANVTGTEKTAFKAAIDAEPSTVAGYEEALNTLSTTSAAFTAAKTNYDIFAKERALADAISTDIVVDAPTTADEALTQFRALKVAEYNYVATAYPFSATSKIGEFTSWTRTGTVNNAEKNEFTPLTSQHWSGTAMTYYEQPATGWDNSAWTANYTKVTTLPAGSYVIKVAARAASGTSTTAKITCSAATLEGPIFNFGDTGKGITVDGVASFDEGEFCNGGNGRGFVWNYLPFTLEEETEVTMKVTAAGLATHQWFSVCDGELLSKTNIATAVAYNETASNTIEDVDVANITMTRTIKDGFNTVVLPFDLTAGQVQAAFGSGTEVYAFSENGTENAEEITINFNKVVEGTISANVPFLVKATAESTEQVFNGVQVVAPTEDVKVAGTNASFVGVYAPETIGEGHFFVGNGAIYKSAGSTNINAFRAYVKLVNPNVSAGVKLFIGGQDYTTAILGADAAPAQNGAIYNIAGQRVSKAQKGIFIVNGKKVVK